MRAYLLILLAASGLAFADSKTGTFSADGSSETVSLQYGRGYLLLGAGDGQNFGSGTLTLEMQTTDPTDGTVTYIQMETYTALPDPSPVVINLGGATAVVRLTLASSTSPDLDWSIVEARVP